MMSPIALGWFVALLDWQVDNLTYRGQGSYRFNFAQRRSLVLACDVEIVSITKQPYESLKSLPPNAHYGFAVLFHGSTPFKRVDLEFPVTRIFYARNDVASTWVATELATIRILQGVSTAYDCLSPTSKGCSSLGLANPDGPILPGHPETIVKVKTPETSQFNIIAYWIPIPDLGATNIEIDGSDGSDDLDEFPRPKVNDPDNPFDGNPSESPRDPQNDPRDYNDNPVLNPDGTANYTISFSAPAINEQGNRVVLTFSSPAALLPGSAPFTATTSGRPVIVVALGQQWFNGVNIVDRFGQVVIAGAFAGTGFESGTYAVNLSL